MTETFSGSCISPSPVSATFSVGGSVSITASTCSLTQSTLDVPLPPVPLNALLPVGSAAGEKSFDIGLSCPSGLTVKAVMTDATNPANRTDLLTLDSSSTAHGVALKILRNGSTPVSFGPDSGANGVAGQWTVGSSGSLTSIPLKVQYQSVGPVSAGSVSAKATITLSYQ
ncbi:F17f-G fimbrial adhesin precursor [compost metagenome]